MVLPSLTSLFQTTAFKRIIVALSYILLSTSLTLITKCLFSKYGFNNVTSLILAQQFFIIVSSFKCCCVSHRSVYETYSDGLCYSVFIMEFLSPIALDFRLFVPNRAFSRFITNPKQKRQKKREREGEKGVDIFPANLFCVPQKRRSGCLLPKGV